MGLLEGWEESPGPNPDPVPDTCVCITAVDVANSVDIPGPSPGASAVLDERPKAASSACFRAKSTAA